MQTQHKTVLSVGQCRPDNAAITHFLTTHFPATVRTADTLPETLSLLDSTAVDLVLINRLLDADYSDGLEVLRQIRSRPEWQSIPVMLVSNYPDWQNKAVALGAIYGFGKAELNQPTTRQRLAAVLQSPAESV